MSERKIVQQNQQRKLFVKDVVGSLHASMTNNQAPKVLESIGWEESENLTEEGDVLTDKTNANHTQIEPKVTKDFSYVSLFSGIGGFEQALNKLGGTCVLASEIDKFANQAYEALYGEPTAGDITQIDAEDIPNHDVLVGGFPCQAFSVAGKRGGFEDARGTLFFEVVRIAAEKKPRAILLENVKGLVGHDKGKTLDTIVKALNECGYRVDFNVLNSKYFGVPQNRERIFLVCIREDLVDNEAWTVEGTNVVAKGKRRISGYDDVKTFNFDWPAQENVTTRLRDVLEAEVDERYYLSEEKTAKLVAQLESKGEPEINRDVKMIGHADIDGHDFNRRIYSVDGVSRTLNSASDIGRSVKVAEPTEVANGDNLSYCIDANYTKGISPNGIGKGRRTHVEESAPKYRIRKLTPLETWRLQGFPDEAHATVEASGISNSQRYRQAGNAVSVPVIQAIGEKLLRYLG